MAEEKQADFLGKNLSKAEWNILLSAMEHPGFGLLIDGLIRQRQNEGDGVLSFHNGQTTLQDLGRAQGRHSVFSELEHIAEDTQRSYDLEFSE